MYLLGFLCPRFEVVYNCLVLELCEQLGFRGSAIQAKILLWCCGGIRKLEEVLSV